MTDDTKPEAPTELPDLQLTPDSSQVHGFKYDPTTKVMQVAFNSNKGRCYYEYPDVTPEQAEGLAKAESPGKYVDTVIKADRDFKRIDLAKKPEAAAE